MFRTLVTRGRFKIEFNRFYTGKMYRSKLGISPKNRNIMRIEIYEILRVARHVVSIRSIKNVSSSRGFGGSVNVVVGGIG